MTSNYKDIVKLGIDLCRGSVVKYSADEANETLRNALIEANGGSTKLDYRAMRDGKCNGVFAIVEEIIRSTVPAGLQESDFFNALVDFRNISLGDENVFLVEDSTMFHVDRIADGTQAIRRQRIENLTEVPVATAPHGVRIYEELSRILAGRVDFTKLIDKVVESEKQQILSDIYSLWYYATDTQLGGSTYYPGYSSAGSYDEDVLLTLIAHVEAAAGGRQATVIGTKKALKPLTPSILGPDGKNTIDTQGYVGKFYGSDVICVPQRHVAGTSNFVFDDKMLTVVANGDDGKPIKFVYEGDPLVIPVDARSNMDLTQEYFLQDRWGGALVTAGGNTGIGRYQFS